MENLREQWKDIPGFEGWYQASNQGRIRSVNRLINYKKQGCIYLTKGKILSPKTTKTGYLEVVLVKNGVRYNRTVHRLVAITFIDNPNDYPVINHINEIKTDNRVENLEWCTVRQNTEAYTTQRNVVYQYDLQGNLVKVWNSITRAAESIGTDKTGIQHCCSGKLKTFKNYIWTYCPINQIDLEERLTNRTLVQVKQLDLNGVVLHTYNSTVEAAKAVGCNPSAITMAINGLRKTIKGYQWKRN